MRELTEENVKFLFVSYFDGSYEMEPQPNVSNTFQMGVCKLSFENNILSVWVRRPGLLIGKKGCTKNALEAYLGCKLKIYEFNLERD